MSHQPERKEKDCLNCGTIVQGRFCHVCGQENILQHQSFWSLTKHFIYDIFHFDGKFFDTLKYLLFQPGRVPKEYVQGKRTKYLDPIRMYLFVSAVFFLVFFSIQQVKMGSDFKLDGTRYMTWEERYNEAVKLNAHVIDRSDTILRQKLNLLLDTTKRLALKSIDSIINPDSTKSVIIGNKQFLIVPEVDPFIFNQTDSSVSDDKDENLLEKGLHDKWKKYQAEYNGNTSLLMNDWIKRFLHQFPYILFVSLPLFALILKLLYVRRKNFFYSDHAIFTLYHYIFSFILLLLIIGFQILNKKSGWGFFNTTASILLFVWPVYLLIALKRFYKQGWLKTIGKFLLLNILGFVSLLLIFILFTFLFIIQL